MDHKNYKVISGSINTRKALDSEDFLGWNEGDILGPKGLDYPEHFPIEEMLFFGKIEVVPEDPPVIAIFKPVIPQRPLAIEKPVEDTPKAEVIEEHDES